MCSQCNDAAFSSTKDNLWSAAAKNTSSQTLSEANSKGSAVTPIGKRGSKPVGKR